MLCLFCVASLSIADFRVAHDWFLRDGERFQVISGSVDYFRLHPDSWASTLQKVVTSGFNSVQVSVPWNLHEPEKGKFNFNGIANITRFIELCAFFNLFVVLRPGPFIGGEWEFGGLPYWLITDGVETFRSMDAVFIKHVDDWLRVLFQKLKKFMIDYGGNVIMVQVEHMYGNSSVCDKAYLEHLCVLTKEELGRGTFLFTLDAPSEHHLKCGSVPKHAYASVGFGTDMDVTVAAALMKSVNGGGGPTFNGEFVIGEPTYWKDPQPRTMMNAFRMRLGELMKAKMSLNVRIYAGGTNFGFYNGAKGDEAKYAAVTTSYSSGAVLTDAGDMTSVYPSLFGMVIGRVRRNRDIEIYPVSNSPKRVYKSVVFEKGAKLLDVLEDVGEKAVESSNTLTFEELHNAFGFVLYEASTNGGMLEIPTVRDMAVIMVDGKRIKRVMRGAEEPIKIPNGRLQILVENMGRSSHVDKQGDSKGLLHGAKIDGQAITGWRMTTIPLNTSASIHFTKEEMPVGCPAFYYGTFNVDVVADTFLDPTGFKKGVVFVNGFNIGRYWVVGPQLTLYIPAQLLKPGTNEVVVFETGKIQQVRKLSFSDSHKTVSK